MDRPSPLTIVVLILAAGALLVFCGGCATVERAAAAGKRASISCGKQYAPAIASIAAGFGVRTALEGLDEKALENAAYSGGAQIGGCAVFEFWRAWKELQKVQVAALGGEADPVAKIGAVLARLEARWGVEFTE